jgi:hypothetical protein
MLTYHDKALYNEADQYVCYSTGEWYSSLRIA